LLPYLEDDNIVPLREAVSLNQTQLGPGLSIASNIAVMCADDPARPTVESLEQVSRDFNQLSDLLAESAVTQSAICAGWPTALDPIPPIATGQAPASIVIGGPTDAQTPLIFAQQMAPAVGGQFLLSQHLGHTVSFQNKSSCVDSNLINFLLDGSLPTTGVCEAGTTFAARSLGARSGKIVVQPLPPIPLQHEPFRATFNQH